MISHDRTPSLGKLVPSCKAYWHVCLTNQIARKGGAVEVNLCLICLQSLDNLVKMSRLILQEAAGT